MMQLTNLKVLMMLLTNLVLKVLVTQLTNLKVLMMLLTMSESMAEVLSVFILDEVMSVLVFW